MHKILDINSKLEKANSLESSGGTCSTTTIGLRSTGALVVAMPPPHPLAGAPGAVDSGQELTVPPGLSRHAVLNRHSRLRQSAYAPPGWYAMCIL